MSYVHLIVLFCRLGLATVAGGLVVHRAAVAVEESEASVCCQCPLPTTSLHRLAVRVSTVWPLDIAVDVAADGYHQVRALVGDAQRLGSAALRLTGFGSAEDRSSACLKTKPTEPAFGRLIRKMCT